jgi:hypothetical protein
MAPVRKRPTPRSDRPKLAEQPSAELSEQQRDQYSSQALNERAAPADEQSRHVLK